MAVTTPPRRLDAGTLLIFAACTLLAAGNFIAVEPARYLKRFHRGSAHRLMRWQGMSDAMNLYRIEVEARIGSDPLLADRVLAAEGVSAAGVLRVFPTRSGEQ